MTTKDRIYETLKELKRYKRRLDELGDSMPKTMTEDMVCRRALILLELVRVEAFEKEIETYFVGM